MTPVCSFLLIFERRELTGSTHRWIFRSRRPKFAQCGRNDGRVHASDGFHPLYSGAYNDFKIIVRSSIKN